MPAPKEFKVDREAESVEPGASSDGALS